MQIPFGTASYQHSSLPLSAQRMVNSYLEIAPPGAKTPAAVLSCFGIRTWITVGSGPMRAGLLVNGLLYVLSGAALYSVTQDGLVTKLGSLPGTGPAFMASDGAHVMITMNGPSYIWDGAVLSLISDPNFPGYQWVTPLDGYMIGGPGDSTFYINHTAFDPTVWNALDFASAESAPGNIVVGITDHREVFFFKATCAEVWYNSGDPDFPLTRTASGYMEIGTTSKYGPAKIDNTIYFPASDGTVRRVDGYTPIRISTNAIEQAIAKYKSQECIGHTWIENGHSMYGLTYGENTFVFDISTQLWHERQSYAQTNWKAAFVVRGNNVTYVGDSTSNRLGILDANTFTEWDQTLVASVTSPAISAENEPVPHASLELVFEQGVGTPNGQGYDPQVMVDFSDDGGRTWSSQLWRSLGKAGEFKRTARWNRLGSPLDRVYRYVISDPVRRTLIQALLKNAN